MHELAEATEGFSGRDLKAICQEAVMSVGRVENPQLPEMSAEELGSYRLKTRRLEAGDFEAALAGAQGWVDDQLVGRYEAWGNRWGRG